ncbi:MAG: exopolysaccharide Pel transporter PelG [Nitrospirae bacterium]|nr:exopolysaccharide Pel transporter PelG [Nitrospirota bacterium]
MAGIGFALRRMVRSGNLLEVAKGYGYAGLIAAGPWLFTVLALAGIYLLNRARVPTAELVTFQVVVTYNFSLSLVLSGGVVLTTTRYLADCIYEKSHRRAPGLMLAALGLVYALGLLVAVPFYCYGVELALPARLMAIVNFFLVAGIWVVTLFLSALKDYRTITGVFGAGMAVSFLAATLLAESHGTTGMLAGFSLGLLLIKFTIISRVFTEYAFRVRWPAAFWSYFSRYWELTLGGFLFAAAIWVDKWVMWLAPERQVVAGAMTFNRYYDVAMFLACLTAIPAMTMFTVYGETGLFERMRDFFRDIHAHATYARIVGNQQAVILHVLSTFRGIILLQVAVSATVVFFAPGIIALANGDFLHLGIFRLGVLGALFYTLVLLVSIILSYLDHRRANLMLQLLFLVLNGGFTYLSIRLGFAYYGLGFFAASLVTFVVGYTMLMNALRDLPYLVFIKNNPSIR